jgi:hypothetical protein
LFGKFSSAITLSRAPRASSIAAAKPAQSKPSPREERVGDDRAPSRTSKVSL